MEAAEQVFNGRNKKLIERGGLKMKVGRALVVTLICMVLLTNCAKSIPEGKDTGVASNPSASTDTETGTPVSGDIDTEAKPVKPPVANKPLHSNGDGMQISPADLSTEQGIREYLVGDWFCTNEYMSTIAVNMIVTKDLTVQLSFYDTLTNESKGKYKGDIVFSRMYAASEDPPDLLTIELDDDEYIEADFYFKHMTIYDGKRVMSLFPTGSENSVFDILTGDSNSDYMIEEIMLEKVTGEISQGKPRKNDEFYAVFWGHGIKYESLWIDDVPWMPLEEDSFALIYPAAMTDREIEGHESILYGIDPDEKLEIVGDDLFKGDVYYVETDIAGNIVKFISADYKKFLDENPDLDVEEGSDDVDSDAIGSDAIDNETKDLIFDIITNDTDEIQSFLDIGMSILFTGETVRIDGENCYTLYLGTDHEDSFVREKQYAVNISTRQIYLYSFVYDSWLTLDEAYE